MPEKYSSAAHIYTMLISMNRHEHTMLQLHYMYYRYTYKCFIRMHWMWFMLRRVDRYLLWIISEYFSVRLGCEVGRVCYCFFFSFIHYLHGCDMRCVYLLNSDEFIFIAIHFYMKEGRSSKRPFADHSNTDHS